MEEKQTDIVNVTGQSGPPGHVTGTLPRRPARSSSSRGWGSAGGHRPRPRARAGQPPGQGGCEHRSASGTRSPPGSRRRPRTFPGRTPEPRLCPQTGGGRGPVPSRSRGHGVTLSPGRGFRSQRCGGPAGENPPSSAPAAPRTDPRAHNGRWRAAASRARSRPAAPARSSGPGPASPGGASIPRRCPGSPAWRHLRNARRVTPHLARERAHARAPRTSSSRGYLGAVPRPEGSLSPRPFPRRRPIGTPPPSRSQANRRVTPP